MEYGSIQFDEKGCPVDRSYHEGSLPDDLREIIRRFLSAQDDLQKEMTSYDLYSGINAAMSSGEISDECARYLRERYLWPE